MSLSDYKIAHAVQQRSPLHYGYFITLKDSFNSRGHISLYISQQKNHGSWLHNSQTAPAASIISLYFFYLMCTAWIFQLIKRS